MKHQILIAGMGIAALMVVNSASAGDAAKGEAAFKKSCAACHSVKAGEKKIGPSLAGIVGRKPGTVEGFQYSEGFTGPNWDAATLDKYLADPKQAFPKTKMTFPGVKDAGDRGDIITFLGG